MLTKDIIGRFVRHQTPPRDIALPVAKFDVFTQDIDPQDEHGFGMFDFHGERCMWKINSCDLAYRTGCKDLTHTLRMLTILLASAYRSGETSGNR